MTSGFLDDSDTQSTMLMETMQRIVDNDDIHGYLNFVRSHIGPSIESLMYFATKADAIQICALTLIVNRDDVGGFLKFYQDHQKNGINAKELNEEAPHINKPIEDHQKIGRNAEELNNDAPDTNEPIEKLNLVDLLYMCTKYNAVKICRSLIVNFHVDVNVCGTVLGDTPLASAISLYPKEDMCEILLNAGANPLMLSRCRSSPYSRLITLEEYYVHKNKFKDADRIGYILDNMKEHARFRIQLRILRAGHESRTNKDRMASLIASLHPDAISEITRHLTPDGFLLSPRRVAEIYASPRPWFTSGR
jgi:hypothetical protein